MLKNKYSGSFVFLSGSGCLLPAFIIFNLFFGWIFLKPLYWLITEGVLIFFLIINGRVLMRKIASASRKHGDAIDIKGEVVEENDKLKIN